MCSLTSTNNQQLNAYKRLAAQDFSKVLKLHFAEVRAENAVREGEGAEADGGADFISEFVVLLVVDVDSEPD